MLVMASLMDVGVSELVSLTSVSWFLVRMLLSRVSGVTNTIGTIGLSVGELVSSVLI